MPRPSSNLEGRGFFAKTNKNRVAILPVALCYPQQIEKENCMSNSIKETLQAILDEASEKIEQSDALDKLNDVRVNFLGKKGQLTSVLKSMKDVAPEDRPKVGQMVNEARAKIETMMEETKTRLEKELREAKMAAEVIDVTLPAKKQTLVIVIRIPLHWKK